MDDDAASIRMLSKPRGHCERLLAIPEQVIVLVLLYHRRLDGNARHRIHRYAALHLDWSALSGTSPEEAVRSRCCSDILGSAAGTGTFRRGLQRLRDFVRLIRVRALVFIIVIGQTRAHLHRWLACCRVNRGNGSRHYLLIKLLDLLVCLEMSLGMVAEVCIV